MSERPPRPPPPPALPAAAAGPAQPPDALPAHAPPPPPVPPPPPAGATTVVARDGGAKGNDRAGRSPSWWQRVESLFKVVARGSLKAGERLPPGVRSVAGISLMIGGVLGFLPVLGFWMFPAGVALLSLDLPPLRRRLDRWLGVDEDEDERDPRH